MKAGLKAGPENRKLNLLRRVKIGETGNKKLMLETADPGVCGSSNCPRFGVFVQEAVQIYV